MKISKTAVLALGGVIATAGLGLMVVNAATPYKDLLVDLNNAVQHFKEVRLITETNDSQVIMTRLGGTTPLAGIDANNATITNSGLNDNAISSGTLNTILGGKGNELGGNDHEYDVILGGETNKIKDKNSSDGITSKQNVILGGKENEIHDSTNAVILGGLKNKVEKSNYSVVAGNGNTIENGSNSLAVGKNNTVKAANSVVLGSGATSQQSSSFLWANGESLNATDVFVVIGKNGMVVGGNKAHSFAKLNISGSLLISEGTNPSCGAANKGVIILKGECFCACDGKTRNALHEGVKCSASCSAGTIPAPSCGEDVSCPSETTSYQGSCGAGQLVQGSGSHFIDKDNVLHWMCESADGRITSCSKSVDGVTSCLGNDPRNSTICGSTAETCSKGEYAHAPKYNFPDSWRDKETGLRHRWCKYGAVEEECVSDNVCGSNKYECVNGATELSEDVARRGVVGDYITWFCTRDGRKKQCSIVKDTQCGEHAEKTYMTGDIHMESKKFKEKLCSRGTPKRIELIEGNRYEWFCVKEKETGTEETPCKLYLYPECGTGKDTCNIGTPSKVGSNRQCTNGSVTEMCALNGCVGEKPDSHSHFWTGSDKSVSGKVNVTLRTHAEANNIQVNKCSYVCDDGYIFTGGACAPCVPGTWRKSAPDTCTLGSGGYCRINSGSVYDGLGFPSNAIPSWNEVLPIDGVDRNITCYDERDRDENDHNYGWWKREQVRRGRVLVRERTGRKDGQEVDQLKNSCVFLCDKGTYCTSVAHSVSCKKPQCVMGNLGNAYIFGGEPDMNTPGLDEYYLQAGYTFVSSAETTGQFNQYIKNNSGCWYRCPEENRYSSGGVVFCYDTGTLAQLNGAGSSGSGKCLGEESIYGYYWIDDDSRNPKEDTGWTYAPRKTGDGGIEGLKKDGVSCLFTCDNPEDSHEEGLYHLETDLYVEADVEGMQGEIKYSPGTFDCVPKQCGNREIYTSITGYPEGGTPCHPCKKGKVPFLGGDLYYGLPISCETYTCPREMSFDDENEPTKCVRTYTRSDYPGRHNTNEYFTEFSRRCTRNNGTLVVKGNNYICNVCIFDCEKPNPETGVCEINTSIERCKVYVH